MSAASPIRVRSTSHARARAACLSSPRAAARRLFELVELLALVATALAAGLAATATAQAPTYLSAGSTRAQPAGSANADVLVVDWDGDGFKDLITTNIQGNTLGALRGLPGGRFEPPVLSTIGPPGPQFPVAYTFRAAAGDLDLDGALDVVVGNPDSKVLTTLLGDNTGAFSVNQSAPLAFAPVDLALADFNGDGLLDLLATLKDFLGQPEFVVVAPGDGTGSFNIANPHTALPGSTYGACAVADVNGDGWLDVVGASPNALPVAFGNGAFGFSPPLLNQAFGAEKYVLVLTDVSGDLVLDAVMGDAAGQVVVRLGDGAGNFALPLNFPAVPPGTRAVVDLVVADATNDGRIDVVTANSSFDFTNDIGPDSVSVLGSAGGGFFQTAMRLGTGENPVAVATADLDRDGWLDVVTGPWKLGNAALLWGRPNGLPRATELYGKPAGYHNRSVVALADLSADGDLDVLATDYETGELDVMANDGAGNLAPYVSWFTDGYGCFTLDVGDLNGDPWPDAVVTSLSNAFTTPLQVTALLGTPAGGFGAIAIQPLESIDGWPHVHDGFDSVALGDWNGDGRTDAVVSADFKHELLLLLGNGAGAFAAPIHKALPGLSPYAVEAGDMNGDGVPDLVVVGSAMPGVPTPSGFVQVLLNNGAGVFTGSALSMSDHSLHSVELADVDLDGTLDVLALRAPTLFAPNDDPDLWVWSGDGAGQLTGGTGYEVVDGEYYPFAGGVAVGDLNGDGLPDAAVSVATQDGFVDDRVRVLPGDGKGGFGEPFDFACGNAPAVVAIGDLEGDGPAEVVVGANGSLVSVLRNAGPQPWRDLGDALAGTAGEPLFVGQGRLQGGDPMKLSLVGARPSALTYLFISLADNPTPFKGGVLHPVPVQQTFGFITNPKGQVLLATSWPASVPPGLPLVLQCAIADPVAPAGAALSNGIKAVTQ